MEKITELKKFDVNKLKESLLKLRKESFNLRFQKASGQLEKTSQIKSAKKEIARLKTKLSKPNGGKNA